MTAYLNREPTAAELEDERRRLAYQAYREEHGYSPLSPVPTPPPSPTSVVPNPPVESEYSPVTPPDSGDDEPADSEAERARAIAQAEYDLAFALRGRDEDHWSWSPVSDAPVAELDPPTSPAPTGAPEAAPGSNDAEISN
jgi:hypothetical protein